MATRFPRYSSEDFARRSTDLYENKFRSLVERGNYGRILSIAIETGDYALGEDCMQAATPLLAKNPDAQIWSLRIGHVAVDKFGGGDMREKP